MKARALTVSLLAFGVLIPALSSAQKPESSQSVLKFEMSQETKLQGVIEEVKDRLCPMSGAWVCASRSRLRTKSTRCMSLL